MTGYRALHLKGNAVVTFADNRKRDQRFFPNIPWRRMQIKGAKR